MVRPPFRKAPPVRQQAILGAALDEFAAHGFHDASLNRIIEAAGISKGSMYYYFDGKEDLFAHVARVEFEHLLAAVGPLNLPTGAHELGQAVMPWIERVLETGRAGGAVRTDLPSGPLIAVASGMGRAMGTWIMAQPLEGTVPPPIGALVGMLRRALQP